MMKEQLPMRYWLGYPVVLSLLDDKGFICRNWQNTWFERGINLLAFTRKNQHEQIHHKYGVD